MTAMTTVTVQAPASVADTLRRARALIEDPKHWIKGEEARITKRGRIVAPQSEDAGAWCAMGALRKIDGAFEGAAFGTLARAINDTIWVYNDAARTKHADVLNAFDKAIALAESGR